METENSNCEALSFIWQIILHCRIVLRRYFLILSSIENNLIYLFITPSQTGLIKNTVFVEVESHSILYSSKIACLQIDWLIGYNGIMTEH